MPYRRRRRSRRSSRRMRRRAVMPFGTYVPRTSPLTDAVIGGGPWSLRVPIKYNQIYTLTAAGTLVFRGNGAFDPEVAAGGAQPRFFDQWSALYRRYYVESMNMRCEITNDSAAACVVAILAAPQDTTAITPEFASELPLAKSILVPQFPGTRMMTLSRKWTSDQLFGCDTYRDLTFHSLTNDSPNRQWYAKLGFDTQPTGGVMELNIHVKLTYIVRFEERRAVARS